MTSSSNQNVTEDMIDACSMPKAMQLCKQNGITPSSTRLSDIKVLLKSELIRAGTNTTKLGIKMASSSNQNVTEDMIDACSMSKAMQLCRQHEITSSSTQLSDIKVLLKSQLICSGTNASEAAALFGTMKISDSVTHKGLFDMYEKVKDFTKQLQKTKGPAVDQINHDFRDIRTDLELSKQKMMETVPTILVLGETGSGKSSFVNLLLGKSYFPSSILSCSHVVCEIRFGEKRRVVLQSADSSDSEPEYVIVSDDCTQNFVEELKTRVQMLDDEKRAVYKRAQVYLPCDILKSGLIIVDSPGIGESAEMTNMVIDYILKADVFIYIIDSTNAGGMQDRVKKLVSNVYRKSLDEQKICRPDTALFICNKWDDIPVKERDSVLNDIRKKIKDAWLGCKDDQNIRFSTLEAAFIQSEGKMAPKFKSVLQSIVRLVEVGRHIIILRGFSLLFRYIGSCMQRFDTLLSQKKMTITERHENNKSIKKQLTNLTATITYFFHQQQKELKSNSQSLANELGKYFDKEENRQKICRFANYELPRKSDWKDVALEVRYNVYKSLLSLIEDWIKEEDIFTKLAKTIEESLESKCPDFRRDIYQAEKLPLATKTGTIFRAPVFGIQLLYREITLKILGKDFKAANGDKEKIRQVCHRYADKIVDDIISKVNLNAIIEENLQPVTTYLSRQEQKMKTQIDYNIRYLRQLNKEMTNDEHVQHVVSDLKEKSASIESQLQKLLPNLVNGIQL